MTTPNILFANPKKAYEERRAAIDAAIMRALEGGWYILGPEVDAFEHEYASWMGGGHCVGAASGTDAIELALRGLGVGTASNAGRPRAVFTVSHTAVATVAAIERAGAVPVLVDVLASTYTMDPASLEAAIVHVLQERADLEPAVIIPVHLYGHPCDMDEIMRLAAAYGLAVLEDCAQAHGACLRGRKAGTFGQAAAFSFYPTKNLGALGDAGGVYTPDAELAERMRSLRQYGWKERYISAEPGINSRLDPIQAAVLREQLKHLDHDNDRRRAIAACYDAELAGPAFLLPSAAKELRHAYHLYVIRCKKRDRFIAFMKEHGIGCALHYPKPVHQQPAYQGRLAVAPGGLPVTEEICSEIVSLPMYPQLTMDELAHICLTARAWAKEES